MRFSCQSLIYCLLLLLVSSCVTAQSCEADNAALRAMSKGLIEVTRTDGSQLSIAVKIADNNKTRAAGFQRVCHATIADTPILFVFAAPSVPRFHMNNVVAPIDIAFIREDGSIDSVQSMKPYILMSNDKPKYSPDSPVIAALEGHKGFFTQNKISLSANISWSLPSEKP